MWTKVFAVAVLTTALSVVPACSGDVASPGPSESAGTGGASGGEGTGGSGAGTSTGGTSTGGTSTGGTSTGGTSTGGRHDVVPDAGSSTGGSGNETVPGPLVTFESGIRSASAKSVALYPEGGCAVAVPSRLVQSPEDAVNAVRAYVSQLTRVPVPDVGVDVKTCGDVIGSPGCAKRYEQNAPGSYVTSRVLPFAERIEQEATDLRLVGIRLTQNGMTTGAGVALVGIRDGWLMAIVEFGDTGTCGLEPI